MSCVYVCLCLCVTVCVCVYVSVVCVCVLECVCLHCVCLCFVLEFRAALRCGLFYACENLLGYVQSDDFSERVFPLA